MTKGKIKHKHVKSMVSKLLARYANIDTEFNQDEYDLPNNFFEGMDEKEIRNLYLNICEWDGESDENDVDGCKYFDTIQMSNFFHWYIKQ